MNKSRQEAHRRVHQYKMNGRKQQWVKSAIEYLQSRPIERYGYVSVDGGGWSWSNTLEGTTDDA